MTRRDRVIVCATDFSDGSSTVVDVATDIAGRFGASKLVLVHVHEAMEYHNTIQQMVERFETQKRTVDALLDRDVQRMRERLAGSSVQVSAEVCFGKPHREIIELALREDASMVVVGTHEPGDSDAAALGSVAERVVRYAHCTVVVAKPEELFEQLRLSRR